MLVADLFSCVGGHALGYLPQGWKPGVFVEINTARQTILRKHFPDIPIIPDIQNWTPLPGFYQVVVGGPPCKRTSVASAIHGYRSGDSLWPEMLRCIPLMGDSLQWVVVEQPGGNKDFEKEVQEGLEGIGWACQWDGFSAYDLGATHIRRRRFAIAHRNRTRLESAWSRKSSTIKFIKRIASARRPWVLPYTGAVRMADGIPGGLDRQERIEAIGDSNPPAMMAVIANLIKQEEGAGRE